jgi:hypothetical protein
MNIQTATASDIYRALVDIQDRLMELAAGDRITLQRHLGQKYGTAGRAVELASDYLDEARQIIAGLEAKDSC